MLSADDAWSAMVSSPHRTGESTVVRAAVVVMVVVAACEQAVFCLRLRTGVDGEGEGESGDEGAAATEFSGREARRLDVEEDRGGGTNRRRRGEEDRAEDEQSGGGGGRIDGAQDGPERPGGL